LEISYNIYIFTQLNLILEMMNELIVGLLAIVGFIFLMTQLARGIIYIIDKIWKI
jgi:hypothetical protein